MAFSLGDSVRIAIEKWGGLRHWTYDARWLGADEHGEWIGVPAGTTMSRPGNRHASASDQVVLVPSAGLLDDERGWVATFHAERTDRMAVYVDIATPPRWDGTTLRAVDLDLDVVRMVGGHVFVDDEDEFAEHRVSLGYPDEVATAAELSCARVLAAVSAGHPPYDGSHERWLALVR